MAQFLNMYSVDLQKPTGPQPLRQMVCAGDNAANRIGTIVTSDGGTVSLSGSCVGKVVRADGTTVQLSGTISGNQAYVVLDQASCAIAGQIQVAVCWVSGSNVTTLVIAYGSVVSTQTGSPVQPSTPIPDLTQLLAEIENMRTATAAATAAATGALANFAGAFNEALPYISGHYVTYTDGKFYRLTADHAANVTWANTSKVAVTTGGELIGLKQAIATDKANIMANFAGAFIQTTAYPAGTYVTYTDGFMYVLPDGHEADVTWANTTKTQVSVGGELSNIKSALDENLLDKITHHVSSNMLNPETVSAGRMETDGTVDTTANTWYSDYIKVSTGDDVYLNYNSSGSMGGVYFNRLCAYSDIDVPVASAGIDTANTKRHLVIPTGIKYIRITVANGYSPDSVMLTNGAFAEEWEAYFEPYTTYSEDFLTDTTKQKIDAISPLNLEIHYTTNHLNTGAVGQGRLETDGSVTPSDSIVHSDFVPVTSGVKLRLVYFTNNTGEIIDTIRIAAYNANKEIIPASGAESVQVYQVPNGVAYVRVSFFVAYISKVMLTFDTLASSAVWEEYYEPYASSDFDVLTDETKNEIKQTIEAVFTDDQPFESSMVELSGDTVLRVAAPDIKRNYTITFIGDITTAGSLTIGNGKGSSYLGGWVEIDDTNVKVYIKPGTSDTLIGTYPHGLTLTGKINVCIHAKTWKKCDIIITTSGNASTPGGQFIQKDVDWFGNLGFSYGTTYTGRITAKTSGGTYTNCSLQYYSSDLDHELWAFGDSYFDHWPEYAVSNGFDNWMIDGASGRRSVDAYNSLMLSVQKRLPRKILWCMGMNDEDSASSVNTSWYTNYTKLKTYCEEHFIELILCTIPCCAGTGGIERNNYYKNEIIKASGLRYVDIANAVGGEERNSSWYSGLLDTDNTHPTVLGDKVIAGRFLADIPELMDD